MCPQDQYIVGGMMRIQPDQGDDDDDTAANGLIIKCANVKDWRSEMWLTVDEGYYGDWLTPRWEHYRVVCGARARVESPGGDDTALNGLQFEMCIPNGVAIQGKWEYVSNNPGFQIESTYTQTEVRKLQQLQQLYIFNHPLNLFHRWNQ